MGGIGAPKRTQKTRQREVRSVPWFSPSVESEELLMVGLSLSMPAVSGWWLMAQVDAMGTADSLPFGPVKLALLLGWVYGSLYLVRWVGETSIAPRQYVVLLRLAAVVAGPLVFLVLVLVDARQSKEEGNFLVRLFRGIKKAAASIYRKGMQAESEEGTELRRFNALGSELSHVCGDGHGIGRDARVLGMTVQLIDSALQQRASDILIDPKDELTYTIRLRVDGTLRTVQQITGDTSKAVINSIKAVSSMDIAERRRPQDGAFTALRGQVRFSFRVASAGALNGEKLSIRVLNQNADKFTLAQAGLPDRQRDAIATAVSKPSGMVLICGPTGSGKTTTLYSMLNHIDRRTHNVITVEDPSEAHLPAASQLEINPKADITFAKALRSILRQDPDVIVVGEIRDEETAEIALRAAQTGHLVLATIHCDSNATALIRLLDLGVSPVLMSTGLNLLISQRLMRRLCPWCKKPMALSPGAIQKIERHGCDPSNVCEPAGCDQCGGTGYYGRTAVCDLLPITPDLRADIAHNPEIVSKLRSDGEKGGRSNMRREAMAKIILGISSLEDLNRVVG